METIQVPSICPYCGVGCGFYTEVEGGRVKNIEYMLEHPINEGALCSRGNAALEVVYHPERLHYPLKKEGSEFKRISWDEAIGIVSSKLNEIKEKFGPDAVGFLASAKCTNEENYLMQKLARVFGTNNVDHWSSLCLSSTVAGLTTSVGAGDMTNPLSDLANSDCILVIGSNYAESHPVAARWVFEAKDRGAKIILADPRKTPISWSADIFLRLKPGADAVLLNGMLKTIIDEPNFSFEKKSLIKRNQEEFIDERLLNSEFIRNRTKGFSELKDFIKNVDFKEVELITGVDAALIQEAARVYAKPSPHLLGGQGGAAIVWAMGITQHINGTDNVINCANLALITGHIGRPGAGLFPLRGQNNVQGACDMGALAPLLPGYVPACAASVAAGRQISDEEGRRRIAKEWDLNELPSQPGLTVVEMMNACSEGSIKAMYIMGENSIVSDPNTHHVQEALEKTDFLVVQDIFLTETAQLADVVLPAACWAERSGSSTTTERRVQWQPKVVEPLGEVKADWEIIMTIARNMGLEKFFPYQSPEYILREINRTVLAYAGITPERVKNIGGLTWPCPDTEHPGTPILYTDKFNTADGLGKLTPTTLKRF
jgi:formate dehydrogenase major subunit